MVVGDNLGVLGEIRWMVDQMPGISVVCAIGGRGAVTMVERWRPDVVLVDLCAPLVHGLAVIQEILNKKSASRIIALTAFEDDQSFHEVLRAGAAGFILKASARGEVMHAIQQVYLGESVVSPRLMTRVFSCYGPGLPMSEPVSRLSEPEVRLLSLVGQGLSNHQIAAEMNLSAGTVKTYISRLVLKLRARDRVQLALIALRNGLASL